MIELKNTRPTEIIEKIGVKTKTETPNEDCFKESMDFKFKYDKIEERVRQLLHNDKYARKNDLYLLILYYIKMGMIKLIVPLEDFQKANPPESITRAKRHLIEKAKKGEPSLSWLLKDTENIEIRNEHKDLYRGFYQDKKNCEIAKNVK